MTLVAQVNVLHRVLGVGKSSLAAIGRRASEYQAVSTLQTNVPATAPNGYRQPSGPRHQIVPTSPDVHLIAVDLQIIEFDVYVRLTIEHIQSAYATVQHSVLTKLRFSPLAYLSPKLGNNGITSRCGIGIDFGLQYEFQDEVLGKRHTRTEHSWRTHRSHRRTVRELNGRLSGILPAPIESGLGLDLETILVAGQQYCSIREKEISRGKASAAVVQRAIERPDAPVAWETLRSHPQFH